VQVHPPNLHTKPRILQPLLLLPRECLLLSHLDLSFPQGDLPSSRFFESNIKILDLDTRIGPSLLIARIEASGALYVIERSDVGLYTVCKLGSWVELDSLSSQAIVSCKAKLRVEQPILKPNPNPPQVALTTPQLHKDQKKRNMAIEALQSAVRKRGRSQSVSTFEEATGQPARPDPPLSAPRAQACDLNADNEDDGDQKVPGAQERQLPSVPDPLGVLFQPTAADMFENIRNQYFDALYRSMVLLSGLFCWLNIVTHLEIGIIGLLRERTSVSSSCCFSS
jgi:DNA replication regulator SLD3